ncbi:MAG: DUF2865 domain-containing protein [Propylenella sp.]
MRLLQLQGSSSASDAAINEAKAMLAACESQGTAVGFWEQEATPKPRSTALRTWCVRSCDGYYFPISYSTTRDRLDADNTACQWMCPAAEAELFFHFGGEGPEQMRSLSGKAYAELDTAFAYRTALDRSCTCGALTSVPRRTADGWLVLAAEREATRLPRPRPAPGEDPETALNRLGALSLSSFAPATPALPGAPLPLRVILPEWESVESHLLLSPIPN